MDVARNGKPPVRAGAPPDPQVVHDVAGPVPPLSIRPSNRAISCAASCAASPFPGAPPSLGWPLMKRPCGSQ